MDKSLLIAVFVPTTDDKETDFKGKRGALATGYPVGKDLVLTARHVLTPEPPHYRDRRYPVKLRWHYFPSAVVSGWHEIPDEDIVWPDKGIVWKEDDLDATLIRCPRPPDAIGWGIVSCDRPLDGLAWASEGFPRATKYEDRRHPSSFIGKVCSKAPEETYFELTVEVGPEKVNDWKGASGMPVFVGRRILGVVQSVPPKFNARKLFATPAWRLLEDEDFRRLIGYDVQRARLARTKVRAVTTLANSPSAVEALAGQLGMLDEMVGLEAKLRAERLAERLMDTDIRQVIQALRDAHRVLCEDNGDTAGRDTDAAQTLAKAAQLIVPALYDYGVVKWTGTQLGAALVPLPAGIRTVAEIIMAGVDGRPTRFRHRENEDDQPEGELSLPHMPECGIDADGAKARTAMQNHLNRKFSAEETETRQFRRAVDEYLLATFSRPQRGAPARSVQERIQLTADLLANKRRDTGQTFYMLFYIPPEDPEGENAMRTLVQSLKDDYPAIMFLGLDASFEQEFQDRALVDPFCRMLPLKAQEPPAKGDDSA